MPTSFNLFFFTSLDRQAKVLYNLSMVTRQEALVNFMADEATAITLDELNDLAKDRYREDGTKLGPGQFPFKSQILRKALQIAAPAIRTGLKEEGVLFLFS